MLADPTKAIKVLPAMRGELERREKKITRIGTIRKMIPLLLLSVARNSLFRDHISTLLTQVEW